MSTKTLGVVGQGSGWQNSIPTIPTIPTVPTIPTIPTPWGCSKLKPYKRNCDGKNENLENRPYLGLKPLCLGKAWLNRTEFNVTHF